jgi:hypothetical protein
MGGKANNDELTFDITDRKVQSLILQYPKQIRSTLAFFSKIFPKIFALLVLNLIK